MNDTLKQQLKNITQQMVAPGKGILAADESQGTCEKRFKVYGIECTKQTRQNYRQTLITAEGLENSISGVILFDETLRQKTDDGVLFPEVLTSKGILPGIKVDTGSKPHALHEGEQITEGLDGLRDRLKEYATLGAKFAKWREVLIINTTKGTPSNGNIQAHAYGLARYAGLCQEAGIVPIVEPEILMDGSHDIAVSEKITTKTLNTLFEILKQQNIYLPGIILKPSMVISGVDCPNQASEQEVADATTRVLKNTVPDSVQGIAFLSGGQSPQKSTEHLKLINQNSGLPWKVTFSYGRGIQQPCLDVWAKEKDIPKAQKLLVQYALQNGNASLGK